MASVSKRRWTYKGAENEAWVVRYKDRAGVHRSKQFDRQKQAAAFKRSVENDLDAHVDPATGELTIKALVSDYMQDVDRRYREGQLKRTGHAIILRSVNNWVLPHLGSFKARELKPLDLERWYRAMIASGRLSVSTARQQLARLSAIYEYGLAREIVVSNPVARARKNLGAPAKKSIRIPTKDDVQAILIAAATRRPRQSTSSWLLTNIAVHLATFSGLRSGEILGLSLADLDLPNRRVRIARTLTNYKETTAPKSDRSNRLVPVTDYAIEMLKRWVNEFYSPNDADLLFWQPQNRCTLTEAKVLTPSNFNSYNWRRLAIAAGVDRPDDHLHFHALRHFAASWWLNNNMPVPQASRLLGHANSQITMGVYAHAIGGGDARYERYDSISAALSEPAITQELRND